MKNIEWSKTPVYKQFMLKLTETDSLADSDLGFRKHKEANKDRSWHDFQIDLKNKPLMKSLMEKTLANIYSDEEVQYKIKILKNKNPNNE